MRKQQYQYVGYAGKTGVVRGYKCTWRGAGKNGVERARLVSMDGKLDFYVDAAKLTDPPPQSAASRERAEKKQCWECGCDFTYAECRQRDGDWGDAYCGC